MGSKKRPFYRMSYSNAVDWLVENKIPLKKKIDGKDVDILPFPWVKTSEQCKKKLLWNNLINLVSFIDILKK